MPFFAYKGRTGGGEPVQGVLEGADPSGVADQLFGTGITPTEIRATRAPSVTDRDAASLFKPKVQHIDVLLFSRQMNTLLKAGVPIMQALSGLQQSTTNPAFADVVRDIRAGLDSGRELSATLRNHPKAFSQFYVNMVAVGETTGRLEEIFMQLFRHLEFEEYMRQQVKTALRYPTFVIATMSVAIVIINIWVIPVFAKVFKGFNAKLPLMTQVLINFSDFMVTYWPLLLGILVGAFFLFRSVTATPAGKFRWDRFKLKIPVAGKIILKATLARFAGSFALATKSGVPVVQGLANVADTVDNEFIASRVHLMREGVERGESVLRTAINAGVFTPVVLQMLAVGEESGALDDMLGEVAEMYQREVEYELKTLSSQIEPILIIMLGVLVLILALGVFLPIWDLGRAAIKS
jgi:MSHA biogenesis protein MshG